MDIINFKRLSVDNKTRIKYQIINCYQRNKHLYNVKSKEFMNRDLREKSLSELSILINCDGLLHFKLNLFKMNYTIVLYLALL